MNGASTVCLAHVSAQPRPLCSAVRQDFRLDTSLREACEDDLKETCGAALKDMDEV